MAYPMYGQSPVWVPPQPIAGLAMKPPLVPPSPGQVLIRYEIVEPDVGCCKCEDLNITGIVSLVVLVFIFWPLAFIPCLVSDCHSSSQRPVYGYPPAMMPSPQPMGMPMMAPPLAPPPNYVNPQPFPQNYEQGAPSSKY
ncbi:hypothetical protein CEUSTIGMA_g6016.t1 [Chlamydomonas eustigma]|uniref:LITAF domain-containing protein n=1 Tax=Chlamydomonas eustigma TaxID=1157962 RepID=A0A250X684_9CHLO|nr:hypothetical protein CEUSTIGMA_g6016.t1 [Chlamydomonas eustigma]|eukprot:GAX78577.1 hypothetical protein CEUSTIGMA_g6016.t1 [Chlamydomonas eustigma]